IVISSMLTPLEEEEVLREAKKVNDGFGENLEGMIPIYGMHTPKMNKERNPVDQARVAKIKGPKKRPKWSIKGKRFKWRIKRGNPKSAPAIVKSWFVDREGAPLKKMNKRS
ncbi:hypothetical protein A2U01_0032981, partial [Trifolium medium]|nr:hypothetical protein [Trifolium medium]